MILWRAQNHFTVIHDRINHFQNRHKYMYSYSQASQQQRQQLILLLPDTCIDL